MGIKDNKEYKVLELQNTQNIMNYVSEKSSPSNSSL